MKTNPVKTIFDRNAPFVYFHNYYITRPILDEAIKGKKSLEVDFCLNKNGQPYIGHPSIFYEFFHLPESDNLPLDTVLEEMREANLYLIIDCKDARLLPKVQETIIAFGPERCLLHAWVDALLIQPYPSDMVIEPHWSYENLPFNDVLRVKDATSVPLIVSARGLTQTRLKREGDEITKKIIEIVRDKAEVVNFNVPALVNGPGATQAPPMGLMEMLLDNHILPWLNVDLIPTEQRPPLYVGMSDHIELASSIPK